MRQIPSEFRRRERTRKEKASLSEVGSLKAENEKLKKSLENASTIIAGLGYVQELSTESARHVIGVREHEAATDPLTGLPNRRKFFAHIEYATKLLANEGKPVSIAFVDIDHFKLVNDTYGHDAGDDVLRAVVEALKRAVRPGDIGRWGGEEFLVLLPDADEETARKRAEALRKVIEALSIKITGKEIHVTVSLGLVSKAASHGLDIRKLIKQADVALYEAKGKRNGMEDDPQGRNRVVVWNENLEGAKPEKHK